MGKNELRNFSYIVQIQQIFTSNLSEFLSVDANRIFMYWKGRVALYATLKGANIGEGDEIIVPGLTCVVVPNAVLYAGAKPVYADVHPDTLTLDIESVQRNITKNTKAIIIQNTFGLSADVEKLTNICRDNNLISIEDCTHGFGGYYQGKPNGTIADVAFFSTQWNKPFSTGIGGFLLVNNPDMVSRINQINQELIQPNWQELLSLRLSLTARSYLLTDANYWRMVNLFRLLSKLGLVTGSSSAEELESIAKPTGYFKAMSQMQAKVGIPGLKVLPSVLEQRRKAALAYRDVLSRYGKWHISAEHDQNNSHLKFPVLVHDRKEFFKRADTAKIRLSDWFISPIHPVETNFFLWHLDIDKIPVAAEIASKLLTINTEVSEPNRILSFLEKNIDLII